MTQINEIVRVKLISTEHHLKVMFAHLLKKKLEENSVKTLILNAKLDMEQNLQTILSKSGESEKNCWTQMGAMKHYSLNYEKESNQFSNYNLIIDVTPCESLQTYNTFFLCSKLIEDEKEIDKYELENLLENYKIVTQINNQKYWFDLWPWQKVCIISLIKLLSKEQWTKQK